MADTDIVGFFKATILIMLFYSVSITILTYSMPDDSLKYVTSFSDITTPIDLETISADVQESLQSQTDIPVVELGALVFYSGNIFIDLLFNFAFAVPEMIGILINGVVRIFNIDFMLGNIVQLFSTTVLLVLYVISLIQLLTGIRSGRIV